MTDLYLDGILVIFDFPGVIESSLGVSNDDVPGLFEMTPSKE